MTDREPPQQHSSLAEFATGRFRRIEGALINTLPSGDDLPLACLPNPLVLQGVFENFCRGADLSRTRAAASLWSCRYLFILIAPAVIGWLGCRRDFVGCGRNLYLRNDEGGRPEKLAVNTPVTGLPCREPAVLLTELATCHLTPLSLSLRQATALPPIVFWSNLASLVEHCVVHVAQERSNDSDVLAAVQAIMHVSLPVRGSVRRSLGSLISQRGNDPRGTRRRKVCCLCFELPDCGYCLDCPAVAPRGE